jgi:glycosyltransferase involved in cell wall biosynthesis
LQLVDKNILMVSPQPWNHIFVSKHHFATHLAEASNKVYFLNPPSDVNKCDITEYANLYTVHYRGFIAGLRFLPKLIQRATMRWKFHQLQKICKTKFDIVWSFDNSVFFDFSALPKSVYSISHIVDWNQDFEFTKASKTANLCLASSKFIEEKQKKYNLYSFNIGHGFNSIENTEKKVNLNGNNKINCGYAGNLDIQYIDWEIINSLVGNFPHIDFHFAGQWKSQANFNHLNNKPNFFYYGKIKAEELYSFYKKMDLLLLVYRYKEFPKQLANPHKMMEYLGAGRMIVSSWTEQYAKSPVEKLIKMVRSPEDFISAFDEVQSNVDFWNNEDIRDSRIQFAQLYTYENQINRIEKIIKNNSQ